MPKRRQAAEGEVQDAGNSSERNGGAGTSRGEPSPSPREKKNSRLCKELEVNWPGMHRAHAWKAHACFCLGSKIAHKEAGAIMHRHAEGEPQSAVVAMGMPAFPVLWPRPVTAGMLGQSLH